MITKMFGVLQPSFKLINAQFLCTVLTFPDLQDQITPVVKDYAKRNLTVVILTRCFFWVFTLSTI